MHLRAGGWRCGARGLAAGPAGVLGGQDRVAVGLWPCWGGRGLVAVTGWLWAGGHGRERSPQRPPGGDKMAAGPAP